MAIWGNTKSKAKVSAFAIRGEKPVAPVSSVIEEGQRLQKVNSFLVGVLSVSVCLSVVLASVLLSKADITPYVADGGVFGCQVEVAGISS